jgi:uncharacterized protein (TIGR02996 family)
MSDEDALLAAIDANPEEDTPRLVYADWLDEHGQAIRAEFIRVQVEVARVETLPRIILNRYVDLFRRQQDLLDNHRAELLGPLASLPKNVNVTVEFDRGFVSELTLSFGAFLHSRVEIVATRPLPRVVIRDATGPVRNMLGYQLHPYVTEPYSENVASIGTISGRTVAERSEREDGPVVQTDAFRGSLWPRLVELDLSGCRLGDANFAALVQANSLPVLADLDISANDLSHAAVTALLDSSLPLRLRRLILGGNPIGDDAAIELAARLPRGAADQLRTLNLRRTHLGQPAHQALLARFGGRVDLF